MGFFSKLKADMNHGGLKLNIQAPGSIPSNQAIPVAVTITSEEPRTINSVTVKLEAQEHEQNFGVGFGGGNPGMQTGETNYSTIGQVENRDQFTISPGETKTVTLQLYANNSPANIMGQIPNVGGALGAVVNVAAHQFGNVNFTYRIHASADVQGVGVGPHASVNIQLEPPMGAQATPGGFAQSMPMQPAQGTAMQQTPTQAVTPQTPPVQLENQNPANPV